MDALDRSTQPEEMTQEQSVPLKATGNNNPWPAPTRYIAGIGVFIFFLWLINYSLQSLTMLIFAALLAILARPAIHFLHNRLHFSPGLAVISVYLVMALLVFALPILILPNIVHAITSLLDYEWQSLLNGISETLNGISRSVAAIPLIGSGLAKSLSALSFAAKNIFNAQPASNAQQVPITELLADIGEKIGFLGGLISPLASGILSLIFMLMISLQMSLASDQIKGWVVKLFPERYKGEIGSLADRILGVWISFLRGQFALMVLMGLLTWGLNILLGTPQALLLGILAGALEIIPNLGPFLATVPAAILAVLFGSNMFPGLNPWIFMLIVIIGYVLLQTVENQVLVPRILGSAVSLPPLIVLVGVTIAGAQSGIVGVFLATPMMASGKEILDYIKGKIYQEPGDKLPERDEPPITEQGHNFMGRIQSLFHRAGQGKAETPDISDARD